ncbi:hypothetical protein [Escherichia phage vB_EcoM_JNE01]|nr:hypothetical protein [Escherichia phage vB_EcoM_JNE01]
MKIIIALLVCISFQVLSAPQLVCTITRTDGQTMTFNTNELFGRSSTETETTYQYHRLDVGNNVSTQTDMTIDKITLKGRIIAERSGVPALSATVDCN